MQKSDLFGSLFADVNISGSTFENINCPGASLNDANMSGWRVHNANLTGLCLRKANLAEAAISDCCLEGMTIPVGDMITAYNLATDGEKNKDA